MPKTKRVHFQLSDNLGKQQKPCRESSPPIKKPKRPLDFNKLKLQMLDLFRGDQYLTLLPAFVEELLSTTQMQEEFFDNQGHNILAFLLAYKHEIDALHLLTKLFSLASLQMAIKKENYMCLKKFLISQCSQETFSKDHNLERALRIEKFKFLLFLDHITVKNYFEHPDPNFITKKIQADFEQAIKSTKQFKNFYGMSL